MAAKKLKILFVTSELFPFVKTGGLADVSASLPQKLTQLGHEVRIVVPKYGAIDSRKFKIHDVVRLKDLSVPVGNDDTVFSVKSSFLPSQKVRVQIYFIDNEQYFGSRKSLYVDPLSGKDYKDNDERFILFNKAVFELIRKLGWVPDIVHCNDWQCGLVPAYFQTLYQDEKELFKFRILYTVHNFGFQGLFPKSTFAKTGLPKELNTEKGILHNGKVNFMKAGLLYADYLNTVSEGYRKQVLRQKDLSGDLNTVLKKRQKEFAGLVNGIDYNIWNPEKDKFIPKKYSLKTINKNKPVNKKELLERFGLEFKPDVPVIGFVSRLVDFKGIDILTDAFDELMKLDIQLVLLGTGDKKYHAKLMKFQKKYSDKFSCHLGFNDDVAHLIEAGSDMFLMPSKFEPCGLNQMYSMVYGCVPIVRQTGGLADTVSKFNPKTNEGTGFLFKDYKKDALLREVKRAVKLYQDKDVWMKIIRNGMKSDFSWLSSAKKYIELYKTVLSRK